jgi:DNA-nicking Smr family endonuclease
VADADDREALRRALAGVKPLAHKRRASPHRPAPPPVPAQTRRDERAVLAESVRGPLSVDEALDSGIELTYLRVGVPRQVLRRLRRGHWVVQDGLDLHGMTRVQAAPLVADFVRACAARGLRCVRIVHGKGLGSRNREPVLKGKLWGWLVPRDEVLAFCQAPAAEGGSGALLVLLKAR